MFIIVYLMQVKHLTGYIIGDDYSIFQSRGKCIFYSYVYYCIAIFDKCLVLHGDLKSRYVFGVIE